MDFDWGNVAGGVIGALVAVYAARRVGREDARSNEAHRICGKTAQDANDFREAFTSICMIKNMNPIGFAFFPLEKINAQIREGQWKLVAARSAIYSDVFLLDLHFDKRAADACGILMRLQLDTADVSQMEYSHSALATLDDNIHSLFISLKKLCGSLTPELDDL